jgi:malate dehydrogenase (oxaloacetate-decarboxylating)
MTDHIFSMHRGGKLSIQSTVSVKTPEELAVAYTPGVAKISMAIHQEQAKAYDFTIKKNTVAVISDGSAVLGLGDIGPLAALPVMEGKALLFKELANIDAFPICLDTKDPEAIIQTIKHIAPTFGGINLEDISAPRCFEIEKRLKEILDIPVFHDDQHGTAVVVTAAIINALKIVNKKPVDVKVVVSGVGAAGTACIKMLKDLGVHQIVGCDRLGAIYEGRAQLDDSKQQLACITNPAMEKGTLKEVIKGADVFIGLSGPNILEGEDIKQMAKDPIVFAMSNPTPEIMPEIAKPFARIIATGRSDYPNQINNVLCFPGLFRGLLDCQASFISDEMKMATARAIASIVSDEELNPDYIIPNVFNPRVVQEVSKAVRHVVQTQK